MNPQNTDTKKKQPSSVSFHTVNVIKFNKVEKSFNCTKKYMLTSFELLEKRELTHSSIIKPLQHIPIPQKIERNNKEININSITPSIEMSVSDIENWDLSTLGEKLSLDLNPDTKNSEGIPLLHIAINKLDQQMVELLLQNGANPDIVSPEKNKFTLLTTNKNITNENSIEISNLTPLLSVLNEKDSLRSEMDKYYEVRKQIICSIINHGGDVNKEDGKFGLTPLHLAANYSRPEFVNKLIENGANVNSIAFKQQGIISYDDRSNATPMLLAVNSKFPEHASQCIKSLLDNNGDLSLNLTLPQDIVSIVGSLSIKYPDLAANTFQSVLDQNNSKMDYNRVTDMVSKYIKEKPENQISPEKFVSELLGPAVSDMSLLSSGRYIGHLNSWDGLLAYKNNDLLSFDPAFAWKVYLQIPKKIKHMTMILNDIENGKVDTMALFAEKSDNVTRKIKDEIYTQTTNYFTSYNMFLLNRSHLNKISKEEREAQKDSKTPSRVEKMEPYLQKEAQNWCEKISSLEPGKSFSISAGSSNHAIYIEFRKQNDGNLSRFIYNLGAGKDFHSVTTDNKIYPYVVTDIPSKIFENKNQNAVKYLTEVLFAKLMLWVDTTRDMLYDNTNLMGSPLKTTDGLIPMKYQVTGNCSVKNNHAGMYNRIGKIYKFVKEYEKEEVENSVHIPNKLYKEKELQHDLSTIKFLTKDKLQNPSHIENELFRFLQKRSRTIPQNINEQKGERIAFAISNMDKTKLAYYSVNSPAFLQALDVVAKYYKNEKLTSKLATLNNLYNRQPIKHDELAKDIETSQYLDFNRLTKTPEKLEESLFDFFSKRASEKSKSVASNSDSLENGHRLALIIKNLSPGVLDFYTSRNPMMIKYIDSVAKHYNNPYLKKVVDNLCKKYVITPLQPKKSDNSINLVR